MTTRRAAARNLLQKHTLLLEAVRKEHGGKWLCKGAGR